MIIIVDDTFPIRSDMEWIKSEVYANKCTIQSIIKTTELALLVKKMSDCELFCNHRTLQLYNKDEKALNNEDNLKYRENLITQLLKLNISRVEFSGGLDTNYEFKQIDKDLFYSNLRVFLDYYIENEKIEDRILFFGSDFERKEKVAVARNVMMQIRITDITTFEQNEIIRKGIALIFAPKTYNEIIEGWRESNWSKNQIIQDINNKLN